MGSFTSLGRGIFTTFSKPYPPPSPYHLNIFTTASALSNYPLPTYLPPQISRAIEVFKDEGEPIIPAKGWEAYPTGFSKDLIKQQSIDNIHGAILVL
jgi:hypothetical protein